MTKTEWITAFQALLQHFDNSEGTTYLYNTSDREEFIKELGLADPSELREVLNAYHDRG